ncbi:MAG: helix-turn-helix transcriptional regulator [Clostridia bacterium]|nr:helix-turn-helix transcriptional regulator [Clostridia bacterium]
MDEKQDLVRILAANIAACRKSAGMTQAELAEKLGYSDKTVSKWERAEGLPDVLCLKRLADTFGVTADALLSLPGEEKEAAVPSGKDETASESHAGTGINHGAVAAIAMIGVWMLAGLVFLVGRFCQVDLTLALVIAIPVTGLLAVIFNSLWGVKKLTFWLCSFLVVGILFMLCWILRSYHVWQLMWIAPPAVAIIWISCRMLYRDNRGR